MAEKYYYWYFPDFGIVHPIGGDEPEEEVVLFNYASWLTGVTGYRWHVPDFVEWQKTQDHQLAYTQLRRVLQLLQWNCSEENKRWVLKTPFHLNHLDCLLKTFPDAKVIWAHRNPAKCIPSFCSLVLHSMSFDSDDANPLEVGPVCLDQAAKTIEQGMKMREKIGEDSFLDVNFSELIKDPLKEAYRIYEFIGWSPPENLKSIVEGLRQKPRKKGHKYSAAEFGLGNFDHKFKAYSDRFLK